jgi:hypothetical protein
LTFDLFLDVETDPGFDLFTVEVDGAGDPAFLWSKSLLAPSLMTSMAPLKAKKIWHQKRFLRKMRTTIRKSPFLAIP